MAQAQQNAAPARLEQIRSLRAGVAAWPLYLEPKSDADRTINVELRRRNAELLDSLKGCDKDWSESPAADGSKERHGDWKRTVHVTMDGPRFLSLVANGEVYCGGAYPSSDLEALVFDRTSGRLVDWSHGMNAMATAADTGDAGSEMPGFMSGPLRKLYQSRAEKDCRDIFDGEISFLLWPDAKKQRIAVVADGLPHAVAACAQEVDLTLDEARKLGFRDDILQAIKEGFVDAAPRRR